MNIFKNIVENYLDTEEPDLSDCTQMQGEIIDKEDLISYLDLEGVENE